MNFTHCRSHRRLAGAAALVATAITTLLPVAAPASAATGSPTYSYTSEVGDYLGQGNAEHYSPATADFVLENYWGNTAVRFNVLEPRHGGPYAGTYWVVYLSPPSGQRLHTGHYTKATSYPGATATAPGLRVEGEGRGCGTTYGEFTVRSISFDAAGEPTHLDATVIARCDSTSAPAYTATLHY